MHIQPIFLIVLLVLKMAQLKHSKKVEPNDALIGILILYLLIQSLTSNTKEFAIPGATTNEIDPSALANMHLILKELYSDSILTIPGNVHIKGDLLVGTYKDETGAEKGWEDSIEHTCVWYAKKGGADTTAAKWIQDPNQTNVTWRTNSKPTMGGGVFSFRAGHVDLHPIFISRKQPRTTSTTSGTSGTSVDANSNLATTVRRWQPTVRDDIHLISLTDYVSGDFDMRQKIKNAHEVTTQELVVNDIHKGNYRTPNANDYFNSNSVRFYDTDVHIGWNKSLTVDNIKSANRGNVLFNSNVHVGSAANLKNVEISQDLYVYNNCRFNKGVRIHGIHTDSDNNKHDGQGKWLFMNGSAVKCNGGYNGGWDANNVATPPGVVETPNNNYGTFPIGGGGR